MLKWNLSPERPVRHVGVGQAAAKMLSPLVFANCKFNAVLSFSFSVAFEFILLEDNRIIYVTIFRIRTTQLGSFRSQVDGQNFCEESKGFEIQLHIRIFFIALCHLVNNILHLESGRERKWKRKSQNKKTKKKS